MMADAALELLGVSKFQRKCGCGSWNAVLRLCLGLWPRSGKEQTLHVTSWSSVSKPTFQILVTQHFLCEQCLAMRDLVPQLSST